MVKKECTSWPPSCLRIAGIQSAIVKDKAIQFPNPYPTREALLRWKKVLDAANRKNKKAPMGGCFYSVRGNRCFLIALYKTSKFLARAVSTLPFVPRCN
ncbi:hypothetical protein C7Y45_22490 [Brevibacillus brevis]|nr:hypothetical protein C7Y45_22490 [Lysinibacillus sp. SDF0063]